MTAYHIPKGRTRTELRVSNSRFITTIAPATSAAEAHAFIREMREAMPDANHHVYAFKIGFGQSVIEGMSDDGEPSGTAGPPTRAVVSNADVGDIVLVTTRYFGGTKLGTGGLVSAYTKAAQIAIEAMQTEEKIDRVRLRIDVPYALLEQVRRLLTAHQCLIDEEDYATDVALRFRIAVDRRSSFEDALRELSAGRITAIEEDDGIDS